MDSSDNHELKRWIFFEKLCQVIFIRSETYFGRLNIYSYQIMKLASLLLQWKNIFRLEAYMYDRITH